MFVEWTKHLKDQDEKDGFQRTVHNAKTVLERLSEILSERLKDLDNSETSEKAYDLPNWSYKQAHRNGSKEFGKYVLKLINLDQQKGIKHE